MQNGPENEGWGKKSICQLEILWENRALGEKTELALEQREGAGSGHQPPVQLYAVKNLHAICSQPSTYAVSTYKFPPRSVDSNQLCSLCIYC